MPRPKRLLHATALETSTPPDALSLSQFIARVICAQGKNIYAVKFSSPPNSSLLVELPVRFRSTIWMKRGSYVVVDTATAVGRNNKIRGEIVNIVRDEKEWRKMAYWPAEFAKAELAWDQRSDEESTVGKMPPSESEDEEEEAAPVSQANPAIERPLVS